MLGMVHKLVYHYYIRFELELQEMMKYVLVSVAY